MLRFLQPTLTPVPQQIRLFQVAKGCSKSRLRIVPHFPTKSVHVDRFTYQRQTCLAARGDV